jgi:hypothetical protein
MQETNVQHTRHSRAVSTHGLLSAFGPSVARPLLGPPVRARAIRSERLSEVYTKLHEIGADSAEARASAILSGLQVTSAPGLNGRTRSHICAGTEWAHPPPTSAAGPASRSPHRAPGRHLRRQQCRRLSLASRALHVCCRALHVCCRCSF